MGHAPSSGPVILEGPWALACGEVRYKQGILEARRERRVWLNETGHPCSSPASPSPGQVWGSWVWGEGKACYSIHSRAPSRWRWIWGPSWGPRSMSFYDSHPPGLNQ